MPAAFPLPAATHRKPAVPRPGRPRFAALRGFTLIELLIVVAIIAILAAIAVPNMQAAIVRAKVSRTKADMRTIATALETYAVDYNSYPRDGNGPPYRGLVDLTTPIAYQSQLFPDVFNHGFVDGYGDVPPSEPEGERLFELGTGNPQGPGVQFPAAVWALAAYGPDSDDDTDTVGSYPFTRRATPYDVTNGSVSDGDIYRLGPFEHHANYETDANPLVF